MRRVVEWVKRVGDWWNNTRPGRAWAHYSRSGGSLMAGGLAYSALFSLFAALTIGLSGLTWLIGSNRAWRDAVLKTLDSWLPGVVDDGDGSGLVSVSDLRFSTGLGVTSIIAAVVLLFSAASFMGAMRHGLRTMFAVTDIHENPVATKLRDIGGFLVLGLSIVVSSAATLLVSGAAGWLSDVTGWELGALGSVIVRLVSGALVLGVDTCTLVVMFLALGSGRPPRRDLLLGTGAAAVVLSAMRYAGAGVIAARKPNALLASFTVFITLLVWINLIGQVILVAAAWTANPPRPPNIPAPASALAPAEKQARSRLRRWWRSLTARG